MTVPTRALPGLRLLPAVSLVPLLAGLSPAHAQPVAPANPASGEPPASVSIWQRERLTGDWGGLRTRLEALGVSFDLTETDELFANASGGLRQGATFDGKTEMDLGLDLGRLAGWAGARVKISAYQIHGRGLSSTYVGNLLTVSNIEAESGARLADLYLEQKLFDDRLNIRIGQFAADEEFLTSDVAGVFLNATFGWPGIFGTDLPNGGPAYPYSTPGLRIRYAPADAFSVQGAVFSGNPLGTGGNDGGIRFPIDGVFAIVEAAYTTMPGKGEAGLGGNYKLGGWYNSLNFPDLHDDTAGQSLASPDSTGIPARHAGNYGLYASVDHQLYRVPGTEDGGLSGFARVATTPQQDRNTIYVYTDAGLTWKGTFPGRDDDIIGIGFAWANVSYALRSLDLDTNRYTGVNGPIRSAEMVLELTYQAPVTPWFTLQPDFQYVIHPGGNVPQPDNPTQALKNAAVFGLRGTLKF